MLSELVRGKSYGRMLTNHALAELIELRGRVLDLGGGTPLASHFRYLRWDEGVVIESANVVTEAHPTHLLNIETESLPVEDGRYTLVLACNLLEHLADHQTVLAEVRRVLAPRGIFAGTIPFLVNVHPDPHDYVRFTAEGLEQLFAKAGFSDIRIVPVGRGPFVAALAQIELVLPRILSIPLLGVALFIDRLVTMVRPPWGKGERFPLAYAFRCVR